MQIKWQMRWVSIGILTVLLGSIRSGRDVQAANLEPWQAKIPVASQSLINPQNDIRSYRTSSRVFEQAALPKTTSAIGGGCIHEFNFAIAAGLLSRKRDFCLFH